MSSLASVLVAKAKATPEKVVPCQTCQFLSSKSVSRYSQSLFRRLAVPWIVPLHPLPQAQVVHSCPALEGQEVGNSAADRIHPGLVEEARHILEDLAAAGRIEVEPAEEDIRPGWWRCLWAEGAWASLIDVENQEHPAAERR